MTIITDEIKFVPPVKIHSSGNYGLVFEDKIGIHHYFNMDGSYDGFGMNCNGNCKTCKTKYVSKQSILVIYNNDIYDFIYIVSKNELIYPKIVIINMHNNIINLKNIIKNVYTLKPDITITIKE